jgi:hypothetical protein
LIIDDNSEEEFGLGEAMQEGSDTEVSSAQTSGPQILRFEDLTDDDDHDGNTTNITKSLEVIDLTNDDDEPEEKLFVSPDPTIIKEEP